jgi:hypothetical protein
MASTRPWRKSISRSEICPSRFPSKILTTSLVWKSEIFR